MQHSPPAGFSRATTGIAGALVLASLCAVVWGQTCRFGFVWDDETFIVLNGAIRSPRSIPRYFTDVGTMAGFGHAGGVPMFRPLRNLSYLLDFTIAGLDPGWYHVHSALLHLVNAVLVFFLASAAFRNRPASLFAACVFLAHPLQTEAVCWVKCRDDLLAGCFVLGMAVLWTRSLDLPSSLRRTALLCILSVLACLSKIQAIIAPLLLAALAGWLPADSADSDSVPRSRRRHVWALLSLLAVALLCVVWRHHAIGRTAQTDFLAGSFLPTMLTMTRVAVMYLRLAVWPYPLMADYSWIEPSTSPADPRVLASVLLLAAFAAAVFALRRRWPVGSLGAVWFGIGLLPVSNAIPTMQYMAERFTYLPMAGVALTAGALFRSSLRHRYRLASALLLAIVPVMAAWSHIHARVWRNNVALFRATALATPPHLLAPRLNLLRALVESGQNEAAHTLALSLREYLREHPAPVAQSSVARYLGLIALGRDDRGEAERYLKESVASHPDSAQACLDYGHFHFVGGDPAAALAWFERACALEPRNSYAHYRRGASLHQLGRTGEAIAAFQRARDDAWDVQVHKALGLLLREQGRADEAAEVFKEGLAMSPRDPSLRGWVSGR